LVILTLIAAPVAAQTIPGGIDVWTTKDDGNTWVDFTDNPLPAGFFCPGSAAFAQVVRVKGLPIVTNPSGVLKQTDTVIQRLQAVTFDSSGNGSTPIQARAICFQERSLLTITCGDGSTTTWKTRVRINPSVSNVTTMTIHKAAGGAAGGTYDATVIVPGLVRFVDAVTGQSTAEAAETISLQVTGAAWASQPGNGGVTWTSPVTIAQSCDNTPSLTVPGVSSNFAAGWSNSCNPPCPTLVQHQGPHPVTPVPPPPPCTRTAIEATKLSSRTYAGTQVFTVDPAIQAVACQIEPVGDVLQVIGADAVKVEETKK
jgi:hypothetical protein